MSLSCGSLLREEPSFLPVSQTSKPSMSLYVAAMRHTQKRHWVSNIRRELFANWICTYHPQFLSTKSLCSLTSALLTHYLLPLHTSLDSSNVWRCMPLSRPHTCKRKHLKAVLDGETLCSSRNVMSWLFSSIIHRRRYVPFHPVPGRCITRLQEWLNLDCQCFQTHIFFVPTYCESSYPRIGRPLWFFLYSEW